MAFTIITWICLRFITSDKIHLAKNSERGKMTRQTEEKEGRQHQGMDRPGVRQVPERSGEQKGKKKKKKKWRKLAMTSFCGAPTTLEVKG